MHMIQLRKWLQKTLCYLLGVASPIIVAGGEAHRVREPHHSEQGQEPAVSVAAAVLYFLRPEKLISLNTFL